MVVALEVSYIIIVNYYYFVLGTVKTTDTASSNGRSTRGVVHYHS